MNTEHNIQWWGYLHTDDSLHVKRYFSSRDKEEAYESDFVMSVHGPWEVSSKERALDKLKESLRRGAPK